MQNYQPAERATDLDVSALFRGGEGALLDEGYLIAERDDATLRLVTEARTLAGAGTSKDKFRYAFTLSIDDGRVRLELRCAHEADAELATCAEAPSRIVRQQDRILSRLLEEAADSVAEPPSTGAP